jgi:hypothetical protein
LVELLVVLLVDNAAIIKYLLDFIIYFSSLGASAVRFIIEILGGRGVLGVLGGSIIHR